MQIEWSQLLFEYHYWCYSIDFLSKFVWWNKKSKIVILLISDATVLITI